LEKSKAETHFHKTSESVTVAEKLLCKWATQTHTTTTSTTIVAVAVVVVVDIDLLLLLLLLLCQLLYRMTL